MSSAFNLETKLILKSIFAKMQNRHRRCRLDKHFVKFCKTKVKYLIDEKGKKFQIRNFYKCNNVTFGHAIEMSKTSILCYKTLTNLT